MAKKFDFLFLGVGTVGPRPNGIELSELGRKVPLCAPLSPLAFHSLPCSPSPAILAAGWKARSSWETFGVRSGFQIKAHGGVRTCDKKIEDYGITDFREKVDIAIDRLRTPNAKQIFVCVCLALSYRSSSRGYRVVGAVQQPKGCSLYVRSSTLHFVSK